MTITQKQVIKWWAFLLQKGSWGIVLLLGFSNYPIVVWVSAPSIIPVWEDLNFTRISLWCETVIKVQDSSATYSEGLERASKSGRFAIEMIIRCLRAYHITRFAWKLWRRPCTPSGQPWLKTLPNSFVKKSRVVGFQDFFDGQWMWMPIAFPIFCKDIVLMRVRKIVDCRLKTAHYGCWTVNMYL